MEYDTLVAFMAFGVVVAVLVFLVTCWDSGGGCFLSIALLLAFAAVLHFTKGYR